MTKHSRSTQGGDSASRGSSSLTAKETRSYSLDKSLIKKIEKTKGSLSLSRRVNDLLKLALHEESRTALHKEIADFFTAKDEFPPPSKP